MEDRKERLLRLRNLKEQASNNGISKNVDGEKPQLSFRNYDPLSDHLKSLKKSSTDDASETLETQAKEVEEKALKLEAETTKQEMEITSLAPQKPGFDLARELAKRTTKLEKETEYCIAENIRKRFKAVQDISDVGAASGPNDFEDDD
ncbi:hypothetical protein HDU76_000843 [Blyttiomyces sp. JEL0837]|nr:hypothetical protein HDU76_000843 [Blyttiomyces sp. JEL0837]